MSGKDPTSKKGAKQSGQSTRSFQEPLTRQGQEATSEGYGEEAGVHSFSEPNTEEGFREEAAAPESQASVLGIDENLLQIKREISRASFCKASVGSARPEFFDSVEPADSQVPALCRCRRVVLKK